MLTEDLESLRVNIDTTKENHDPIDEFNILSVSRDLKAAYKVFRNFFIFKVVG